MTQVLLSTSGDLVETVFATVMARDSAGEDTGSGLKSGALDAFESAIAEKLQDLKEMAAQAAREGWDAVKEKVKSYAEGVADAAKNFGKRAQEFRDKLMEKIREIISETFDFMLGAMRSELKIGRQTYTMVSVDIEQKLVFTGSIDISVTSLCKLLGSGELVVKGKYAIPESQLAKLAAP